MALPQFHLTGTVEQTIADSDDVDLDQDQEAFTGWTALLTSNVPLNTAVPDGNNIAYIDQRTVTLLDDGQISEDGINAGIYLTAHDDAVFDTQLQWTIRPTVVVLASGRQIRPRRWTFDAAEADVELSLGDATPTPSAGMTSLARGPSGASIDDLQRIGNDLVGYVNGVEVGRFDVSDLGDGGGGGGDVPGDTHAASSKTTPVDADEIPLVDSAASFALKKLTWANLKATLKTYFDALTTTYTNKTMSGASNTFTNISADSTIDGTTKKAFLATERTKLTNIETAATANSSDATLLARANHTGTQSADTVVDGSTNHVFTAADDTKLGGVEALADVTDTANVDAAGAVMNADTSTGSMAFVIDEDDMVSNSATKVPTQQSVKAYVASAGGGGGGDAVLNADTSTADMSFVVDEDNMASNSATKLATQQSIKAYVDTGTKTIANTRITTRIVQIASSATPSINVDNVDQFEILALATAVTSMTSGMSGTPGDGQPLILRIKDNGTARSLTWGSNWRAIGVTLPSITVLNKTLYVAAIYNFADTKWDVLAVGQEA